MVRIWEQTENNRLAEDLAILQRDIGAVMGDRSDKVITDQTPSTACPGFCTEEIRLAEVVIEALHASEVFGYRLGEAVMARMRLEEKLASCG